MSTISERVDRGEALLDAVDPHWHDVIDLDTLDMSFSSDCVVAQWARARGVADDSDYISGLAALRVPRMKENEGYFDDTPFGFETVNCASVTEYRELTEEWRARILRRRTI